MQKKSFLDSIDNYFMVKEYSEVRIYTLLGALVVAALGYFLLSTPALEFYEREKAGLEKVTADLSVTNAYLASVSDPSGRDVNYKLNQTGIVLKKKKDELKNFINANAYVEDKLEKVSSVTYNEKNWAKFLDDLTRIAREFSVKVRSLHSFTKELEGSKVQEVLNVNLFVEAPFNNILNYINSIEESEMVVDIIGIDVNASGKNIAGDINISLWGVKYGDNANLDVEQVNQNLAKSIGEKNSGKK